MSGDLARAVQALDRRYCLDHPFEAARRVEHIGARDAAAELAQQPAPVLVPLLRRLSPGAAGELLRSLPDTLVKQLLTEILPNEALRMLAPMDEESRERCMALLDAAVARDIRALMAYPEDSAGRLMDANVTSFRGSTTVAQALAALRRTRSRTARSLFLIDDDNRLSGKVTIQDVAVSDPDTPLRELAEPIVAAVSPVAPGEEVAEALERHRLADLPVVDTEGILMGVVYHATLVQAMQEDASADIQTMVGASRDERALSRPVFAVIKRLPWLQINLLTAFMAAAVVGIFEDTIARFTALAVLLPVVAGQSGNAGAQALAVTMRGLALREITTRHWPAVTMKEVVVGLLNGIAVAVTCGVGVYLWSGSLGLVLVIASSMVLAMVAAGFAGALVPIALTRLGQDPAQASSIVLTTVTDIAGFFSFLGIATALSALL